MGHLDCFQVLAITNNATMSIVECVSLWHGGESLGYVSKSSIAASSGRSISNFLTNLQNDFQSGCTCLQSHQQWRSVFLSPHLCQQVVLTEVLVLAILIGLS